MYEYIGSKGVFKIFVGCKVLVGWWNFRVMKDLADFSVTSGTCTSAFWLHADHSISILYSCHNDFVIINHCSRNAVYFFPWRVSPAFNHSLPYFRTQGVEKF